jgi:hypothetical protein
MSRTCINFVVKVEATCCKVFGAFATNLFFYFLCAFQNAESACKFVVIVGDFCWIH